MEDLRQQIAALCAHAHVDTDGEFPLITVDDTYWHDLAAALKERLHFDCLTAVVGVDWKDSLGCMYYLTDTLRLTHFNQWLNFK